MDIFSVVSGVEGIASFAATLFPSNPTGNLRVWAGLNGISDGHPPSSGMEGGISYYNLYDEHQNQILSNRQSFNIASGGFSDSGFGIKGAIQTPYVQIHGNPSNAVCIAYMTTTWAGGAGTYGWLGDWGQQCGAQWYWSDTIVPAENYKPKCTWVGGVFPDDHKRADTIMIHWPSYVKPKNGPNPSAKSLCGFPAFRAWHKFDSEPIVKRHAPKRDSRLVVTNDPQHNVTELCSHENSAGPDAVSLDQGLYCNMDTRELLPLCSETAAEHCFAYVKEEKLGKRGAEPFRNYTEILTWGGAT